MYVKAINCCEQGLDQGQSYFGATPSPVPPLSDFGDTNFQVKFQKKKSDSVFLDLDTSKMYPDRWSGTGPLN